MTNSSGRSESDLEDYHPDFYNAIVGIGGDNAYIRGQLPRYLHTLKHMPTRDQFSGNRVKVLELGATNIFPYVLRKLLRFEVVEVCICDPKMGKAFEWDLPMSNPIEKVSGFNIDIESDQIPRPFDSYDMVLCFDVIGNLERDPMFMVSEINRVLKPKGLLYLSTPNICSSRNVMKILEGYAPHFHMKYLKDRSMYRHNIEYAPGQIESMMKAGGFAPKRVWTADTFEPPLAKAIKILKETGFSTDLRGDNFFGIYEKVSDVNERWPVEIYA